MIEEVEFAYTEDYAKSVPTRLKENSDEREAENKRKKTNTATTISQTENFSLSTQKPTRLSVPKLRNSSRMMNHTKSI